MIGTDRGTYTRIAESLIRRRLKRRPVGHFDGVHNSLLGAVKVKVGKLNMKVNHEPN
jgi:hypothetical protein